MMRNPFACKFFAHTLTSCVIDTGHLPNQNDRTDEWLLAVKPLLRARAPP